MAGSERSVSTAAPGPVESRPELSAGERVLPAEFVLDERADAFASLGRKPGAPSTSSLDAVLDATRALAHEGVRVRWVVPLLPALLCRLEAIFSLAEDEGVEAIVVPAVTSPDRDRGELELDDDAKLFAADFVAYRLLAGSGAGAPSGHVRAYRSLIGELTGSPSHPDEAPPAGRLARTADVAGVLYDGIRALAQWARAALTARPTQRGPATRTVLRRVVLIGAYGGEHIGDAAILGGVLLRLQRRYGTTQAVVMSQRPAHTRHLLPMLDVPMTLEVEAYEHARIRARVRDADAVVFAGGPLIDLPKQLVRHLYSASLARRHGAAFIAEGIGPGPFPRRASQWVARRIVCMAERITVRTASDARNPIMKDLSVETGSDPAFDYLATRSGELPRLREQDRRWIERLLAGTDGRAVVALNLRPIRHHFTAGVPAAQRAARTREAEARFEEQLAAGLCRFDAAQRVPACFVFFPMNAIQFGMSDLRSAYRLARRLAGQLDLRVWEADAGLEGVVALLRRVDVAIAMRFHAAIFALAQQRKVIGIDYRVGARDKVGALFDDIGQSDDCRRIDETTAEWLAARLCAAVAAPQRDRAPT